MKCVILLLEFLIGFSRKGKMIMRVISISLFRFNELDDKHRSRARRAILDDRDFGVNTNQFVEARALEVLHKVVPVELVDSLTVSTIYYGIDCVSVELRAHIDSKSMLRRFAKVAEWKKKVEFWGDIDIKIATDSMIPYFFPDDECSTQIARYLDKVAWEIKDLVVKDLEQYLSDDGLADYCVVHNLEFEVDGRMRKEM